MFVYYFELVYVLSKDENKEKINTPVNPTMKVGCEGSGGGGGGKLHRCVSMMVCGMRQPRCIAIIYVEQCRFPTRAKEVG